MTDLKTFLSVLTRISNGLKNPTDAIKKSLNNVHAEGLFSLVVGGEENGKLLRVFIADKKLKPYQVQLHSHRYAINIIAVNGVIKQYVARPGNMVKLPVYTYKSFLNGGSGLQFGYTGDFDLQEYTLPKASILHMTETEIHTVSCSKGSIWIVEEFGFETEESTVLGVPFTVDWLYTVPEMFQINDKAQMVLKYVTQILKDFGN